MKIYDISMTVDRNIPVYRNDPGKKPEIRVVTDHQKGNTHESVISMNLHTGTHIDAPLHMIEGGDTFETIDISRLVTECKVLDLTHLTGSVSAGALKAKDIKAGDFILLKTKNSFFEGFDPEFVFVDISGAEYLKELQINGVGIDSLGIERAQPGHETHKTLMGSGIIILEGLRLAEVPEGIYHMTALPIKMKGTEAAPARVILVSL